MRNRFSSKQKKKWNLTRSLLMPAVLFVLVAVLFIQGLSGLGQTSQEQRLEAGHRAVTQATVQCYAIEGQYPPNIEYLENHYGLSVDRDVYIIQYRAVGNNLMPDILVMPKYF